MCNRTIANTSRPFQLTTSHLYTQGGSIAPPIGYTTPDFPSLYLPRWVFRVPNDTIIADQNGGGGGGGTFGYDEVASHWLYYAEGESQEAALNSSSSGVSVASDASSSTFAFRLDIWHFTLYWHLILHSILFVLPALWFTAVALLSPSSAWRRNFDRARDGAVKAEKQEKSGLDGNEKVEERSPEEEMTGEPR